MEKNPNHVSIISCSPSEGRSTCFYQEFPDLQEISGGCQWPAGRVTWNSLTVRPPAGQVGDFLFKQQKNYFYFIFESKLTLMTVQAPGYIGQFTYKKKYIWSLFTWLGVHQQYIIQYLALWRKFSVLYLDLPIVLYSVGSLEIGLIF